MRDDKTDGVVDLSDRDLTAVPESLIGDLSVEKLLLSGNRLTSIPDWIGTLKNLRWLNVSGNEIVRLPDAIADLSALEHLDAYGNHIEAIPPVGGLDRLEFLGLSRNRISGAAQEVLPKHLRILYLGHNQVTDVPAHLQDLADIEYLHLSGNPIATLPTWIGQLKSLQVLRVGKALLAQVPSELGSLRQLEELALGENQIQTVPVELAALPRLHSIELHDNPLSAPFALAYKSGTRGLLAYLRGLSRGATIRHEAKVLVVGEGETGKSTLLHRLRTAAFTSGDSTHGIEIDHVLIPPPDDERAPYVLNTWDFGGQEVYRITHQFFFSASALYILVWKPRVGMEEGAVESWLRRIRLRIGSDARVLLVATHGEDRQPEIDLPWLSREFPGMIAGAVLVDSRTGLGFDELVRMVYAEVEKLPFAAMPWPESWIDVRDHLVSVATERPQITWQEFVLLCSDHGMGEDECRTLAEILNELGHVVYWADDPTIRDLIVLQPEWLTKAISYVLEDAATRDAGGVLGYVRARELWDSHAEEDGFDRSHHAVFLRLMERFDVSYRIEGQARALVGQLVPHLRPASLVDLAGEDSLNLIEATCELSEDPPGLIPWLIVRSHKDWREPAIHWRRGLALHRSRYKSWAVVEQSTAKQLSITVRAPSPDFYFHVLLDMFEEVASRWPGLTWAIRMPCPHRSANGERCAGQFNLTTLLRARERGRPTVSCHLCIEDIDVAQMLTGFESRVSLAEYATRDADDNLVLDRLARLQRDVEHVRRYSELSFEAALQIADGVRGLFRFVSNEVVDCPRLISLEPVDRKPFDPRRFFERRYRLHLWCEHEDDRHRVGFYDFSQPREWWIEAAPYIRATTMILRGIPMARSVLGLVEAGSNDPNLEADLKTLAAELDLMKQVGDIAIIAPEHVESHLSQSHGELVRGGSRRLKAALLELDPGRGFRGLNRTPVTPTGEFFWVCDRHMRLYDPGLPNLP